MDAKRLLDFLRQYRLAVEASVSESGSPQAAVVGVAITDRFEMSFDTVVKGRFVDASGAGLTLDVDNMSSNSLRRR